MELIAFNIQILCTDIFCLKQLEFARKGNCHDKSKYSATKITQYVEIPRNETALIHAIATIGPITVSIDASKFSIF